ncbi:tetratricopeptide repeat protein [Saccharopolyspora shandongensis]|uniref:ATP-binding protein n=1 Tax=Saccharopolyspora shandongensis TaxID=418495 RepID=UPI0034441554
MSSKFGAELRRLRRAAGLSLSELAKRTHYSKGFLSKVETGTAQPSPALAALCEAELGAVGELAELLPGEPVRRRTRPDVRPSGLPALSAHFVGRVSEQRRVRAALESDGGSCVISGMGGVGKTELAVRCAHRLEAAFADGSLFLDLHGRTPGRKPAEPTEVLDRLLRVLGVPAEQIPPDIDDRAALYRARLRGRSVLLVFDNVHSAAQVRPLLPAEPKCRVLVTSRSRLAALDSAAHVSLDLLPGADAVRLFAAVADVDPSDESVRSITTRCGNLPLAVRVAAARLRTHPTWDLAELHRRLVDESNWLGQLDDGERSLAATLEVSVRDLGAAESRLLGLLALHPGSDFDLLVIGSLAGAAPHEADRLAERLHEVNLLTQPAKNRYAFHDVVRAFAAEFVLTGLSKQEQVEAFRRLLDAAVATAALADRTLTTGRFQPDSVRRRHAPDGAAIVDRAGALAWFRDEWPNLVALCRAAQERGEYEHCWQLAYVLRGFFFEAKLWEPWIRTHRSARAAAAALADRWALASTTSHLGVCFADRGDLEEASSCYREALELFEEIGDEHGVITVNANSGWIDYYRGDHAAALHHLSIVLERYERSGNGRNAAITTRGIALVRIALGEYAEAAELAEHALDTFESLGLELDAVMALNCLGWAYFQAEDSHRSADAYQRAAARADRGVSPYEAARAYTGLGNLAATGGRDAEAAALWQRADETYRGLKPQMVPESRIRANLRTAM